MHMRQTVTSVVTGKPVNIGGSRGRREATGRGISVCLRRGPQTPQPPRRRLPRHRPGLRQRRLQRRQDPRRKGLHHRRHRRVRRRPLQPQRPRHPQPHLSHRASAPARSTASPRLRQVDKHELLTRPCEILIPAATENVVTSLNAGRPPVPHPLRGRQRPHHRRGRRDPRRTSHGIFVIPDILANAGGVTTSYFEWVQDRMGYFWTEARSQPAPRPHHGRLASPTSSPTPPRHDVNNRIAAYMLAIDRVAYTTKQRGIYA